MGKWHIPVGGFGRTSTEVSCTPLRPRKRVGPHAATLLRAREFPRFPCLVPCQGKELDVVNIQVVHPDSQNVIGTNCEDPEAWRSR